jgi:hypothetical protein
VFAAYAAIAVGLAQFVPHAYRTFRANTAGVPPTMFVVCTTANVLWSLYGLGHHAPTVWVPAALNGAAAAALALRLSSQQRTDVSVVGAADEPAGRLVAVAA